MGLGKTLLKTSPVGFAAVKGAEGRKDPEDVQVRHGGAVAEEQAIQDQELFSEQAVAKVSEPEVQLTASPVAALVDPNEKETLVGAKQSTSDELHAKGQNGQITVSGDWLTIERKGFGRLGHSKGDRRIPLGSITAVQMRPAGPIANGFLRFTIPGSPELRGGLRNAMEDENAVIFTRKHKDEFEAVRARVEDYIANKIAPQAIPSAPDVTDQLKKLGDLRDSGVLTDAEFESKKAELLSRW